MSTDILADLRDVCDALCDPRGPTRMPERSERGNGGDDRLGVGGVLVELPTGP